MSGIVITLEQLRGMIGQKVRYEGVRCQVIEVLEDGPSLVLIDVGEDGIQIDQYGNPRRRVPQNYTVPVLSAAADGLHPAFLALELWED
jgi:hypothetical protein